MTTAPAIDLREHRAAIKALIGVLVDPEEMPVLDYDNVPGSDAYAADDTGTPLTLPDIYVLVSIERRPVAGGRMSAQSGRSAWRAYLRSVGRTTAECEWAQSKVTDALEEQVLVAGDQTSIRLRRESSTAAEPDDGRMSALDQFTYVF